LKVASIDFSSKITLESIPILLIFNKKLLRFFQKKSKCIPLKITISPNLGKVVINGDSIAEFDGKSEFELEFGQQRPYMDMKNIK
jgi:hypothetical protein